jgi:hypothetical protein
MGDLEKMTANLASDLRTFFAVVEVEIIVRRLAAETDNLLRHFRGVAMRLDGSKRFPVSYLVLN